MPHKLVDMDITAVASVDRAANKRKFLIIKAAGEPPDKGKDVSTTEKPSIMKRVIGAIAKMMGMGDNAKTMNQILVTQELERELNEKKWEFWDAFHTSVYSILDDQNLVNTQRKEMLGQTMQQFGDKLAEWLDMAAQVAMVAKRDPDPNNLATAVNKRDGDTVMTLDELLKNLKPEERAAVEAEIAKRAPAPDVPESVTKALNDATAKLTEATGKIDSLEKRATDAEARAKENEEKLSKAEGALAAEVEKRVAAEFLEKGAKYPSAGTPEEVADMLRKAFGVSKEYGEKVEATFAKAEEQIAKGDLFKEKGRGGNTNRSSAEAQIEKMAKERAATDKVSYEKAYDLVLQENRDLHKRLRDEQEGN